MTSCLVRYSPLESSGLFSEACTRGPIEVRECLRSEVVQHAHQIHGPLFSCFATLELLHFILGQLLEVIATLEV
jgi:hypothetical protein